MEDLDMYEIVYREGIYCKEKRSEFRTLLIFPLKRHTLLKRIPTLASELGKNSQEKKKSGEKKK